MFIRVLGGCSDEVPFSEFVALVGGLWGYPVRRVPRRLKRDKRVPMYLGPCTYVVISWVLKGFVL